MEIKGLGFTLICQQMSTWRKRMRASFSRIALVFNMTIVTRPNRHFSIFFYLYAKMFFKQQSYRRSFLHRLDKPYPVFPLFLTAFYIAAVLSLSLSLSLIFQFIIPEDSIILMVFKFTRWCFLYKRIT
jgi:hypothetical protein